ncbi:GtrA family protein [Bacillus sp. S/N-304-OC-R1]|uniref:GtrA family protein n=1 Tax=Bacillus sp. S/N-304-OC-R1 TaxID=2758034 RepID=UPI0021AE99C4|nr:GtrA family protein [Bacillus sp. S/N-304-OC-R1]
MGSLTMIMQNYLKRTNYFIRFLFVGVLNTLIGFSIMIFLLNIAGMSYWYSTFLGNTAGATFSYILNRSFTFQSKVSVKTSIFRFMFVILGCYLVAYSTSHHVLNFFVNYTLITNALIAENIAVAMGTCIYTVLNYLGQKYLVFKKAEVI